MLRLIAFFSTLHGIFASDATTIFRILKIQVDLKKSTRLESTWVSRTKSTWVDLSQSYKIDLTRLESSTGNTNSRFHEIFWVWSRFKVLFQNVQKSRQTNFFTRVNWFHGKILKWGWFVSKNSVESSAFLIIYFNFILQNLQCKLISRNIFDIFFSNLSETYPKPCCSPGPPSSLDFCKANCNLMSSDLDLVSSCSASSRDIARANCNWSSSSPKIK